MALSLASLAAKAGTYPSRVADFSRQIFKLAEAVKTYVDAQVAAINTFAEMADTDISSPSGGEVAVYDGSDSWDNVAVSGDATLASSGALTIAAGAIDNSKVDASAAIATSKLAGGSHSAEGVDLLPKMAVAIYDFSVDGSGTSIDLGVQIPDNAVIIEVLEDITTDFNSTSGTTTVELVCDSTSISAQVTADGSNVAAVDSSTGLPHKMSAASNLSITASVDDITAGVARYFVRYIEGI